MNDLDLASELRLVLRTPHQVVFDEPVQAVRVPTPSGHVGLRPHEEPLVLNVEAGLIVLRQSRGTRYAATAGGLLDGDRRQAVLFTPFAAVGNADDVLAALDSVLATPDAELATRRRLGELEQRIVRELRHGPSGLRRNKPHVE